MTHPDQVKAGSARLGIQHGYSAMLAAQLERSRRSEPVFELMEVKSIDNNYLSNVISLAANGATKLSAVSICPVVFSCLPAMAELQELIMILVRQSGKSSISRRSSGLPVIGSFHTTGVAYCIHCSQATVTPLSWHVSEASENDFNAAWEQVNIHDQHECERNSQSIV
ncbi:hypothetical protein BDR06DRAFT_969333 [Suillus hirtellus]|nr:hypothetical protein BDR06DRAFT_969333 [Suillus hirtellus]